MALFKVLRGQSDNFSAVPDNFIPSFHDGYCYFLTDTNMFYIDYEKEDGTQCRIPLSANDAAALSGAKLEHSTLNDSEFEIPSSKLLSLVVQGINNGIHSLEATISKKPNVIIREW